MKTTTLLLLGAAALAINGCIFHRSTSPSERRTVLEETTIIGPDARTVVTTLPAGYRSRTYRGTTYYYHGNTYYRANPSGGYVVTTRPW